VTNRRSRKFDHNIFTILVRDEPPNCLKLSTAACRDQSIDPVIPISPSSCAKLRESCR
jgi:hypothetical protein